MLAVSQKVTPSSTAWRKIGSAVSSPRDQSSRFAGSPKLMQPNAMRLILSPDEPKRVYSMVMSFTRTECDGVRGCSVCPPASCAVPLIAGSLMHHRDHQPGKNHHGDRCDDNTGRAQPRGNPTHGRRKRPRP